MTSLGLVAVVETSDTVARTQSRKEKAQAIAQLLRSTPGHEVGLVVALIAGEPVQGRVGVGWATINDLNEPANVTDRPAASLTVSDLDRTIDAVAEMSGPGSKARRREALGTLFGTATEAEAEFLQRLLLGELRQGANEGVVVDAVAKAAGVPGAVVRRALMLSGDLSLVAETALQSGAEGLAAVNLQVGRPLRPMLASTAADVDDAMASFTAAAVEWKLDGARIQVHSRGPEVHIWTRNMNSITERLPMVCETVRGFDAESLVLDGEILGLTEDQLPQAFQETMSSFSTETGAGPRLHPFFFDILHRDGRDLVDVSAAERRAELVAVCGDLAVPGVMTDRVEVAQAAMDAALKAGHEGVMVKDASSAYEAGRRGKSWRKVKPVHTLDLVVLAAEWGHGRRTGWLSNLHLGALSDSGEFIMVGKTFKGMTDALLEWQTEALLKLRTDEVGITVFVEPKLIVEVALDGVQTSTRYPGGVSLRFARVRRYRDDKTAGEADRIETLQAMR